MKTYNVGDVLLFRYPNFYGKLIALKNLIAYGVVGYTHAAIITNINEDEFELEIAEALGRGFTISNYPTWWVDKKINDGIIVKGTAIYSLHNVREFAKKYEGTAYDFLDLWNIIVYWFKGKESILHEKIAGVKFLICSEAVARILYDASDKQINFEIEFNKSFDIIEPVDLYVSKQIKWEIE